MTVPAARQDQARAIHFGHMMGHFRGRVILSTILALAAMGAHGSGFQLREQGAEGLATANAGSAAKASDAAALLVIESD